MLEPEWPLGCCPSPLPSTFLPRQQWSRRCSPDGLPCLVPQDSSIWASSSGSFPQLRSCAGSCRWTLSPGKFLNSPVCNELILHHAPFPNPASSHHLLHPPQGLSPTLRAPLAPSSRHTQDRRKSCSRSSSKYLQALRHAVPRLPEAQCDKPEGWFRPPFLPSSLPPTSFLIFFLSLPC